MRVSKEKGYQRRSLYLENVLWRLLYSPAMRDTVSNVSPAAAVAYNTIGSF